MHRAVCLCAAVTTLVCAPARSAQESEQGEALPRLRLDLQETRLQNGLRVITVEDHRVPIVSVVQVFNVGAADEQPGRTGFAHLFEHLMFQGSQNVGPGEHIKLVENRGGFSNATTNTDWTAYFDSVPANQLDFALFLNADRLRSLKISEENLAKEREVVKEERRLRIDNQPYRKSGFMLDELLYDSFAYRHDGVGSMADLAAASLADVRRFFDTYYTPGNLVLVIVGDFDRKTALRKVQQYFGALPSRPAPPTADRTEPTQTAPRRRTVEDPLAPLPQLSIAFKEEGHSSRIYQALVPIGLASDVGGRMDERRGAGALYMAATLQSADRAAEAEQTIYREIERLQQEPAAAWEIEKAKSSLATTYLDHLNRGMLRGFVIGQFTVDFGDPARINTYLDRIAAVTADDVRRVANTHLRPGNRTTLLTLPKPAMENSK